MNLLFLALLDLMTATSCHEMYSSATQFTEANQHDLSTTQMHLDLCVGEKIQPLTP